MVPVRSKALDEVIKVDRIIGKYSQGKRGPALIITGGVHGNEPSGIFALKKVFNSLEKNKIAIKGTLLGVTGNMAALKKGVRFIDHDLNRIAKYKKLEELHKSEIYDSSEGKELEAIMKEVEKVCKEEDISQTYFIDCHTTSSESQPYISAKEFPHSVRFALNIPCFTVTGLGKSIPGTMDDYFNNLGFTGFTFEAGQHDDMASIENHEAVIWLVLAHSGMIDHDEMGCFPQCDAILRKTVLEGKKIFRTVHRYAIREEENFTMKPGYVNFQPIEEGELLAHSNNDDVRSEWNARILMPLYQKQGNDGFFIVKEIAEQDVV